MTLVQTASAPAVSARATGPAALAAAGLSARYGRIEVCRDISFEVAPGEFLILLGANGAGKSSLLGALAGIVASAGTVTVGGRRIDGVSPQRRAHAGLALVPEGRGNLFGPLTVDENLDLGLRHLRSDERAGMRADLNRLFPVLAERGRQAAAMLSGGEQQMLALALAIARRPTVLLLDEPSQGLAPVVLDEIVAAVNRLRTFGMALIIAEQNVRFAAALGDRFIALRGGEVVDEGHPSELANHSGTAARLLGAAPH
ncbi:ABC transporter ATP-binding protein [Chelatococcus reniformis]|uniref:ABC transporter ATP-binding protein n=1 Tax=Chelatococcus reniformis TaxID=1494448 RepID=A0A916TXC7_9HYPH|nr:ATP-binding cassette domain-containing protein [Chelatococcus reniformis]GGC47791.1 ABC transporter ATP-binding protein [Chelatococcus reniformis]